MDKLTFIAHVMQVPAGRSVGVRMRHEQEPGRVFHSGLCACAWLEAYPEQLVSVDLIVYVAHGHLTCWYCAQDECTDATRAVYEKAAGIF